MIPQPKKPVEPEYEDVSKVPDQQHDWGMEWDGNYHQGRICKVCGELSECELCHRDALQNLDCLRSQAESNNYNKEHKYRKALERYEAQMDYWREINELHRAE